MSCRRGRVAGLLLGLALGATAALATSDPPRVRRIEIAGATQLGADRVRGVMHLRQRSWWQPFRRNYFYGTDHLESDLARIADLYRAQGFYFARIEEALVTYHTRDWVDITIRVTEGAQSHARSVDLAGDLGELEDELRKEITLRPGRALWEAHLARDEARLLRVCREAGRALAGVTRELRFAGDETDVIYIVEPGPLVRVGEIEVTGAVRTRESVIRREVALKSGRAFRLSRAVRTQERLFDLGLFRSVRIVPHYREPVAESPPEVTVDLSVDVREKKAGWYGFGFGYSSRDRVRFLGEWGYGNLAGRARSLGASGEIAYSLEEEPGGRFKRPKEWEVELIYGSPWLLNTPTRWQIRSYYRYKRWFETGPSLEEDILGIVLQARWELSRFRRLTGSVENKWTITDSTFVTRFISAGLVEDRRDFALDPHQGLFSQAKVEYAGGFLGGQTDFTRWTASHARYVPLGPAFTWAYRARVGYIRPVGVEGVEHVPLDERFFAGGGTTVRGYAEESLGPVTDEGQPTGGLALLVLNAELRFPLFGQLGGTLFLDAGNVWADHREIKWSRFSRGWTSSTYSSRNAAYGIGAGLRFATPVGPIRLDYGLKMGRGWRSNGASDHEWHLSLGQAF